VRSCGARRGSDRIEQRLTHRRELAADDDPRGEQVDGGGQRGADGLAGIRDGAASAAVAGADERDQLRERDLLTAAAAQQAGQRHGVGDRLQASPVAAATDLAVVGDGDVAAGKNVSPYRARACSSRASSPATPR